MKTLICILTLVLFPASALAQFCQPELSQQQYHQQQLLLQQQQNLTQQGMLQEMQMQRHLQQQRDLGPLPTLQPVNPVRNFIRGFRAGQEMGR